MKCQCFFTYIKVFTECSENNWSLLALCEQEYFWLSWVIVLEDIVVGGGDLNDSVSNVSEGHLLKSVSIESTLTTHEVRVWDWEWRIHSVGGVLSDALVLANLVELIALD